MRNFQDTSGRHKQSFVSAFSICMTVPLNNEITYFDNLLLSMFLKKFKNLMEKTTT